MGSAHFCWERLPGPASDRGAPRRGKGWEGQHLKISLDPHFTRPNIAMQMKPWFVLLSQGSFPPQYASTIFTTAGKQLHLVSIRTPQCNPIKQC